MTRINPNPQPGQPGQPHAVAEAAANTAFKAPTWWSWIVFWVVNKLHIGFPLFNALLGYKIQWTPAEMEDKTGQVILVTGANSGTGYETAKAYYEHGAKVYVACRSAERAAEAIADIKKGGTRDITGAIQYPATIATPGGSLEYLHLDLTDLNTVEAAARTVLEREQRLDVLFANAGIMATPPGQYTKQGYTLQFGTNVVGHQRLISLLLPLLRATSRAHPATPSRLISLSSVAHEFAPRGNHEDGGIAYDALTRTSPRQLSRYDEYGESKWGNIALARWVDLHYGPRAPRHTEDGEVLAFAVHPGPVSSNLGNHLGFYALIRSARWMLDAFQCTPHEGALGQLWAANLPVAQARMHAGGYVSVVQSFIPARPDLSYPQAWEKLWNYCEAQAKRAE